MANGLIADLKDLGGAAAQVMADDLSAIRSLTAGLGVPVDVAGLGVLDRAGELPLGPAGLPVSPNGACRMFRAADGWIALNLARPEDHDLVAAWLSCDGGADAWALVSAHGGDRGCAELVERAILLGLPAARVGEVTPAARPAPIAGPQSVRRPERAPRVVDLSALWAGPLCGAILAAMGAEVTRIDSLKRPDPTRWTSPAFHRRLNGGKAELPLDLSTPEGQAALRARIDAADIVITSARPRGLASIGLDPPALLTARPELIWVAITGYGLADGWSGPSASRVAFGDDAAAAGGLVRWNAAGEPGFLGDALADPITGLAAALGALRRLEAGVGGLVDAGMAPAAAAAALRGRLAA
jgi:hypothetical protein